MKARHSGACAAVVIILLAHGKAMAIDANFVRAADSSSSPSRYQLLEVNGFSGRMVIQSQWFSPQDFSTVSARGVSVGGGQVFTLRPASDPGVTRLSRFALANPQDSGASVLSEDASDVAYTNGRLFAVINDPGKLRIVSYDPQLIGSSTLTNQVVSVPGTGTWKLSGRSEGNLLLAYRADAPGTTPSAPRPAFLINTTSGAITGQFDIPVPAAPITDVVMNRAGTAVTLVTANQSAQTTMSLPTGSALPPPSPALFIGSGVTSDNRYRPSLIPSAISDTFQFSFTSPSDSPAAVIAWDVTGVGHRSLFRLPRVLTANIEARLVNGVLPDNVSSLAVSMPNIATQTSGPSPIAITSSPSAATSFQARTLGTGTATINLATAAPGFYRLGSGALSSSSTNGITVSGGSSLDFAYEPISDNLVGNGGFDLLDCGWQSTRGGLGGPSSYVVSPDAGTPAVVSQVLELPTANRAMAFHFETSADRFQFTPGGSVTVAAYLNGTFLGQTIVASPSLNYSFSSVISDPALFGLNNALLSFTVTPSASFSPYVYLDSVSLVAIPEPTAPGFLTFLAPALLRRRRQEGADMRVSTQGAS